MNKPSVDAGGVNPTTRRSVDVIAAVLRVRNAESVNCVCACAPTRGLEEQARVISPHGSNALSRVSTEMFVNKRVAKWREGDRVDWMLPVVKNLGESATNRAIATLMKAGSTGQVPTLAYKYHVQLIRRGAVKCFGSA